MVFSLSRLIKRNWLAVQFHFINFGIIYIIYSEAILERKNVCKFVNILFFNREFCSRFQKEDTILFVLRVMVGLIILYDHVHPVGAFSRSAHIDVSDCSYFVIIIYILFVIIVVLSLFPLEKWLMK